MQRREFVATGMGMAVAPSAPKPLNYNPNMVYRRLGKTGLQVSAICMGGHWKRVATMIPYPFKGAGYMDEDTKNLSNADFIRNRTEVVNHAMACGMNYVDACSPQEILAYSKVLQGRRDKMYFGFSWHTREPRFAEWRKAEKLVDGLQASMKEARLDYVDVWRISLPMEMIADMNVLTQVENATVEALLLARKKGLARFTGVSSHNRIWLRSLIAQYPEAIQVVLFPYTANTKELPGDSVFEAIKQHDVGVFGIKPFADNSLFAGDSSLNSPQAAEDSRKARLALRYILGNPGITAPIPGLINTAQVDNAVAAVAEWRKRPQLTLLEHRELEEAGRRMWANLDASHAWLRKWEYV
jgi:aryl-alcohol dehydrogenase-like predicted oxidoreductase